MRPRVLVLLALTAALALGAATAGSGAAAPSASAPATASPGKIGVKYTVKKFVRRGHRLYAYGTAITRYIPASGAPTVARQNFKAAVALRTRHLAAVQTTCPVLDLILGPLDLNLLGAMVHLDQVHLTITANSDGGLLGSLLCKLQKQGKLTAQTKQLNWAVQKSGLATNGAGMVVSLQPQQASSGYRTLSDVSSVSAAAVICPVLDLTIGPIHLDLLGLVVDTNTIHLTITADSEGGLLGSLLCSLAGAGG